MWCSPIVLDVLPKAQCNVLQHRFCYVDSREEDVDVIQHLGVCLTLSPTQADCLVIVLYRVCWAVREGGEFVG